MPPLKTQKKRRFEDVVDDDIFDQEADSKRPCVPFVEGFEQRARTQLVLERWTEFEAKWMASLSAANKEDYVPDLRRPPSDTAIQKFFQWMVRHIPGQSDRRMSVQTLKRVFDELKRIVRYRTGHQYEKHIRDGISKYIESLAVTEGASVDVAPKGLANFAVVQDILYFLWVCDEYTFNHPRFRLQLAFGILLCSFRGIRPGEIVESSLYRGTNDGLKYKDVKLVLTDAEGFILLIRRRLKKGARNQATRMTWEPFFQSPENRACCVVTHFIALAIADGALTMPEILDATIDPGANSKHMIFPEKVQELPIIRAMDSDQYSISATKILTFTVWNKMLVDLGRRAGYEETLTSYCFRRGVGNALDKSITSAERQREMGHKNEATFMHYLSKVSGVDSQAIVMGEDQRKTSIDWVRSMNFRRNLRAPNPYSLTVSGSRAPASASSRAESFLLSQEKRKRHKDEHKSFFDTPTTELHYPTVGENVDYDYITENGVKRVRPKPSRFVEILFKYDPVRAEVANTFYPRGDEEEALSLSMIEAISILAKLANPKSQNLCYPVPFENDKCTWCGRKYEHRTGRAVFNDHLLQCHRTHWQKSKQEHNNGYCVFKHPEQSPAIQTPSVPIRPCRKIPTGRLDVTRCSWSNCGHDFVDQPLGSISEHVTSSHVLRTRAGRCLWNNCYLPVANTKELSTHLLNSHDVPSEYTLTNKAYFCHQCAEWTESTSEWHQHCEGHLQDLKDRFCGRIARASVVIFAALCPFCLGGPGEPSQRYHQIPEGGRDLEKHIKKHLASIGRQTYTCPHPLCNDEINGEDGTFQHLREKHGMVFSERKRGKKEVLGTKCNDDEVEKEVVDVEVPESLL